MCAYLTRVKTTQPCHTHEGNTGSDTESVRTNRGYVALAAVRESSVVDALAAGGATEHNIVSIRIPAAGVRRTAASAVVLQTTNRKYMIFNQVLRHTYVVILSQTCHAGLRVHNHCIFMEKGV